MGKGDTRKGQALLNTFHKSKNVDDTISGILTTVLFL